MAELCIKLDYQDPVKEGAATLIKSNFPLWSILPILGAIFCAGISILMTVLFALVPLVFLTLLKTLSTRQILMDKRGIEMPSDLSRGRLKGSYLGWDQIARAFVSGEGTAKEVVFLPLTKDLPTIKVPLDRLDGNQTEKLLVTIQLFMPGEKDASLEELSQTLKRLNAGLSSESEFSYTDIWEDELKRRFRPAAFMPLEAGVSVREGSIRIERALASGGLSAVYLASTKQGKLVVLKESVIPESYESELKEKAKEMFAREARLLMKLDFDKIVKVLDFFSEGGRSYLLLESVTGPDLRQYVKQHGKLRESLVLDLALQMADILVYLHSQEPPVIHRDFTPDNLVLQNDGKLVAIDFGAANEFIGNATGTFVGKHAYIAPEQFRGKASPQSDLYAMGGTLYYLLTGEDPLALSVSDPAEKVAVSPALAKLVYDLTLTEGRIASAAVVRARLEIIKTTS